jgi:hypothetical protein
MSKSYNFELHLNSKFGDEKSGQYTFTNNLHLPRFDSESIWKASLSYLHIQNVFDTVYVDQNDMLEIVTYDMQIIQYRITPGRYTPQLLQRELERLTTLDGFTVTYNRENPGKIRFSNANMFTITEGTTCWQVIGKQPSGNNTAKTYTDGETIKYIVDLPNAPDMSTVGEIYLMSNLGLNNYRHGIPTSILSKIPVASEYGKNTTYINNSETSFYNISNQHIDNITLWWEDDYGKILDFKKSPWSCTIKFQINSA